MADNEGSPLRQLPSMDRLLKEPLGLNLINGYGREATREALRVALDAARQWIRQGGVAPEPPELLAAAATLLRQRQQSSLRPIINATGVILHTNLGRAPLSESAQQALVAAATGYSTLEYELEEGKYSARDSHVEALITGITGAEAAFVVNNNTSAVMLILTALGLNREVIVSRGQLVEIGGFRIADVIVNSGARLVEVGATNRAYLDDFAQALGPQAALIMRVNGSNFRQIGFAEQPELAELAALAHAQNVLAIDNLGSGALLDTALYGLEHEPMVQESIRAGFDLVVFSADKLLGGPQAGIIVGRTTLIERLKQHPLARAMRIDKLRLAALWATLDHYRRGDAPAHIPVWQMITLHPDLIRARADAWAAQVGGEVIPTESTIGGGNLPSETLPSYGLALNVPQPDSLAARLRRHATPIVTRIARQRVLLDPRTVLAAQDAEVVHALEHVLAEAT